MSKFKLVTSAASGVLVCECCNGTGYYDEGFGPEECSVCNGTGHTR